VAVGSLVRRATADPATVAARTDVMARLISGQLTQEEAQAELQKLGPAEPAGGDSDGN
jgi:hypothetical protein